MPKKEIPCQECSQLFETPRLLGYHMRRKHGEEIPKWETKCKKLMASETKMKEHEEQCEKKGLKCEICGECFIGQPKLKAHKNKDHLIYIKLSPEDEKQRNEVKQVVFSHCKHCDFHDLKFAKVIEHSKVHNTSSSEDEDMDEALADRINQEAV